MTIENYTEHTLNDESARLYEHETLFSFRNDVGNSAFNEWWEKHGYEEYKNWVNGNLERLNSEYY